MRSPILCFYGPPGVGKTSLGKSIAKALGRQYIRISLGGVHDEAEIRGHRKTYIGAMPGRIMQNLKKAGSANPVFVLDEIDNVGRNAHGDPSSALLEVLDPEQNNNFYDNYVEQDFDLSRAMFIATANNLSTIQPALLDRMELIEVTGYTQEEKVEIAKQHLIPTQITEHGLKSADLKFSKKAIEKLIDDYTRESGVRSLEKRIAKVIRSVAKLVALEEAVPEKLEAADISKIMGPAYYHRDKYENNDVAGVVTGLAWTSTGGDILFIEALISKGNGKLSLTGNLGDVMKESAVIALEFLKAHGELLLGLNPAVFNAYNIHIHVPEGATPKDGPSAGIAMLTSMVSSFTQKRIKKSIAMTGEITLRGKVLPVGGIKEKILAAKRANIKEIILCKDNKRDIEEIKPDYIEGLTFHYVDKMSEVLDIAITSQKVKNAKEVTSKK
jgi:ATP-dependent Lon protease